MTKEYNPKKSYYFVPKIFVEDGFKETHLIYDRYKDLLFLYIMRELGINEIFYKTNYSSFKIIDGKRELIYKSNDDYLEANCIIERPRVTRTMMSDVYFRLTEKILDFIQELLDLGTYRDERNKKIIDFVDSFLDDEIQFKIAKAIIEYSENRIKVMQQKNNEKSFYDGYFEGILIKKLKTNIKKFNINLKDNKNLINGKKPNISERYKIANDVCGIFATINKMNISATEKHILLAHIMGCSQQTARELFNGTQVKRTPIREDIVNPYLETLK
jgi:hypothetical protein